MANYRQDRINDALVQVLSELIPTVKDYRVRAALVTVTAVDCTKDLKLAKVYVSSLSKQTDRQEVLAGLKSAAGYLRGELASRLNLRMTPELLFYYDDSMTHGAHILQLLQEVEKERADKGWADITEEEPQ